MFADKTDKSITVNLYEVREMSVTIGRSLRQKRNLEVDIMSRTKGDFYVIELPPLLITVIQSHIRLE